MEKSKIEVEWLQAWEMKQSRNAAGPEDDAKQNHCRSRQRSEAELQNYQKNTGPDMQLIE